MEVDNSKRASLKRVIIMTGARTTLFAASCIAVLVFACYVKTALIISAVFLSYHYNHRMQRYLVECLPPAPINVLLITAHPDDEAMFFAPFVRQLSKWAKLHVLCFSNGNFYGHGTLRAQELIQSCVVLGVTQECVSLVNDDAAFPDSPLVEWDVSQVRSSIELHCKSTVKFNIVGAAFGRQAAIVLALNIKLYFFII